MSNYQDIYRDLPSRVYEVWQRTKKIQEKEPEDRSVTAMLMAAAGLAMPFESLKDVGVGNGARWKDHPAFETTDRDTYQAILKSCESFFKQPIAKCAGLQGIVIIHCKELRDIRNAVETGQPGKPLELTKQDVRFVTKILRNALAHNNILAFGASENQIEKLTFFSENRIGSGCKSTVDGWHALTICVKDFELFLHAWFDLLKGPGSYRAVAEVSAGDACGQAS